MSERLRPGQTWAKCLCAYGCERRVRVDKQDADIAMCMTCKIFWEGIEGIEIARERLELEHRGWKHGD